MSEENVETVRAVYAEWKLGKMTAGVNLFDPEITFESFMPDADEKILVKGSQEIEQFMREFLAQWRDFRILGEEFKEADGGKVFVGGRQSGTGRGSGILVDDSLNSVWTFREGAVVRLLFERDRRKALEAAGLSE